MKFDVHLSNNIVHSPCGCCIPSLEEPLRLIDEVNLPLDLSKREYYIIDKEGFIIKCSFTNYQNKNIFEVFTKEEYDLFQQMSKKAEEEQRPLERSVSENFQCKNIMVSPMPVQKSPPQGFVFVKTPYDTDTSNIHSPKETPSTHEEETKTSHPHTD